MAHQDHVCAGRTCVFCRTVDRGQGTGKIRTNKPTGPTALPGAQALQHVQALQRTQQLDHVKHALANNDIDDLEKIVFYDNITGLYNTRTLTRKLHREISRARRYKRSIAVCMIALNGPGQGDAGWDVILREAGVVLQKCVRETDIAARYSRNEILIVMPDTDINGAYVAATRFQTVLGRGLSSFPVKVSLAIAACPRHAKQDKELMAKVSEILNLAINRGVSEIVHPG